MNSARADALNCVSGTKAAIPARIRHALDIQEGHQLQWTLTDDESARIEVVCQRSGTFAEFDGYEGDTATDVTEGHDAWDVVE